MFFGHDPINCGRLLTLMSSPRLESYSTMSTYTSMGPGAGSYLSSFCGSSSLCREANLSRIKIIKVLGRTMSPSRLSRNCFATPLETKATRSSIGGGLRRGVRRTNVQLKVSSFSSYTNMYMRQFRNPVSKFLSMFCDCGSEFCTWGAAGYWAYQASCKMAAGPSGIGRKRSACPGRLRILELVMFADSETLPLPRTAQQVTRLRRCSKAFRTSAAVFRSPKPETQTLKLKQICCRRRAHNQKQRKRQRHSHLQSVKAVVL